MLCQQMCQHEADASSCGTRCLAARTRGGSSPWPSAQEEFLLEYGIHYWRNVRKERERSRLNEVRRSMCNRCSKLA